MIRYSTASSLLVACGLGRAANPADDEKYWYEGEAMRLLGLDYTWDAHETVTNDGYHLTMFRIIGDSEGKQILG